MRVQQVFLITIFFKSQPEYSGNSPSLLCEIGALLCEDLNGWALEASRRFFFCMFRTWAEMSSSLGLTGIMDQVTCMGASPHGLGSSDYESEIPRESVPK